MVPDHEHDPFIEGIAAELRRPVRFDSGFDARVMEALDPAVLPMRRRSRPRTPWLLRPRTMSAQEPSIVVTIGSRAAIARTSTSGNGSG